MRSETGWSLIRPTRPPWMSGTSWCTSHRVRRGARGTWCTGWLKSPRRGLWSKGIGIVSKTPSRSFASTWWARWLRSRGAVKPWRFPHACRAAGLKNLTAFPAWALPCGGLPGPLLRGPYRRLRESGLLHRLLKPAIRSARFQTRNGMEVKYVFQGKTVGLYDPENQRYAARKPYDLFLKKDGSS